jgi:hypothetical protein
VRRDRPAQLPAWRSVLFLLFPLRTSLLLLLPLRRPFFLRALGGCGIKAAPLGIVERRIKEELIGAWAEYRAAQGAEKASLILAHTRVDVRELNLQARVILKKRGELGKEARVEVSRELAADDGTISIERGERYFAPGARVMFLKNDRELGVKDGSLGTGSTCHLVCCHPGRLSPDISGQTHRALIDTIKRTSKFARRIGCDV